MKKRLYTDTGDNIKKVRATIPGLTQKSLANEVGCTTDYIAMLERGEKPLTEGMAYKIAKACGVATDYLLGTSENMYASAPIDIFAEHDKSIMWNYFIEYISKSAGYEIERVQADEIPDDLKSRIVCKFKNDSCEVPVSSGSIKDYFDDITEYAIMRMKRVIQKEGSSNG